jgi:hypothetical protein
MCVSHYLIRSTFTMIYEICTLSAPPVTLARIMTLSLSSLVLAHACEMPI